MEKFVNMLGLAWEAYTKNLKLVSFSVIPFLLAFPVALMLPNYAAIGAIFLRFDSIRFDLSLTDTLITIGLPLVSMLFFSFAIAAINMVVTSQRTMRKITFYELERIEQKTFQLFEVYLLAFAATFAINVFLYQYGLHPTIGALISALIAIAIIYVPQAIVIDGASGINALKKSIRTAGKGFPHTIMFLAFAAILMLVNDGIFIQMAGNPAIFIFARYAAIVVNALVILPFLEVLKVQLYLSKYTLL